VLQEELLQQLRLRKELRLRSFLRLRFVWWLQRRRCAMRGRLASMIPLQINQIRQVNEEQRSGVAALGLDLVVFVGAAGRKGKQISGDVWRDLGTRATVVAGAFPDAWRPWIHAAAR
jgi:hypothetical protein